ncbi:hypothetical protein BTO14_05460 [Polaribacter butkevichii]|uniref:Uncharacterized protein n=2 Tax=Polaribacter butkevichii TaxID=218490 RepID=A0A2P6CCU9_9FLAO|nr:hypothetical protein BTO14_05460 [Polaribacter butkevichii]
MTHLIALDHSFEHHSEHKQHSLFSLNKEKVIDINNNCSLCDIYLNIQLSKDSTFTYTLLTPKLILNTILGKDNSFTSVILNLKKSRAPPIFIA